MPPNEARKLYRFRTEIFKENCKSSYLSTACPLCFVQPDSQVHCIQFTIVKLKVKIEGTYNDIFYEKIPSEISKTVLRILQLKENLLKILNMYLLSKRPQCINLIDFSEMLQNFNVCMFLILDQIYI